MASPATKMETDERKKKLKPGQAAGRKEWVKPPTAAERKAAETTAKAEAATAAAEKARSEAEYNRYVANRCAVMGIR
jgi:hypothetical protein